MELNKAQRKKARRKAKKQRERAAGRDLDAATGVAIEEALALASESLSESAFLSVELNSATDAQFVRKRINEALMVEELLDHLNIEIFEDPSTGKALLEVVPNRI